jgi:hypothetical protein
MEPAAPHWPQYDIIRWATHRSHFVGSFHQESDGDYLGCLSSFWIHCPDFVSACRQGEQKNEGKQY